MKNKFLIGGSAIAAVVLVLASLSPVVGFDSVRSSMKDSPLFHLRTKRAIGKEQNTLTCTYFGKGKVTDILFPTRNSKSVLLQRAFNLIGAMDENEFDDFLTNLIHLIKLDNAIRDEDVGHIVQVLYLLKANPNKFGELDFVFTTDDEQYCFLNLFLGLILLIIFFFLSKIAEILPPTNFLNPCYPSNKCYQNIIIDQNSL